LGVKEQKMCWTAETKHGQNAKRGAAFYEELTGRRECKGDRESRKRTGKGRTASDASIGAASRATRRENGERRGAENILGEGAD